MNLLLLSNSTNAGEAYLDYCKRMIRDFLPENCENILFIPYAGVHMSFTDYTSRVNEALKSVRIATKGLHEFQHPAEAIQQADAIIVGGGNSFQLLDLLQKNHLIEPVREKVSAGTYYIGWSAGSNMVCPTLMTTNDMPVVEPESFNSFGLIPFQINPHYTEQVIPGHGGESRDVRILEFIELNRKTQVIGLPEGMAIQRKDEYYSLEGDKGCKIFYYGLEPEWIYSDDALNRFLQKGRI